MKNVQRIIEREGGLEALKKGDGFYIKLGKVGDSFMPLVIEYIGKGPHGLDCISVSHYYIQEGDVMRDPEMTFEIVHQFDHGSFGKIGMLDWDFRPVMFQQDNLGIYQELVFKNENGNVMIRPAQLKSAISFSKLWDRNIGEQGYLEKENEIKKEKVA